MALRLAICRVPSARQVVITAGRPSGMAATARATSAAMRGSETEPGDPKKGVQKAGFSWVFVMFSWVLGFWGEKLKPGFECVISRFGWGN